MKKKTLQLHDYIYRDCRFTMVKKKSFFALVNFFTIVKSCMERKENELSGWVCHSWYGIYSLVTLQKLCKYCSHPEWFLVTVQIFEIHIRPQNLKNIQLVLTFTW